MAPVHYAGKRCTMCSCIACHSGDLMWLFLQQAIHSKERWQAAYPNGLSGRTIVCTDRATACRVLCCCGCRTNWCRCCAATGGDRQPSACYAKNAAAVAAARRRSKQTPPHPRRHLRSLHPQRPTASQSEAWSKVCAVHRIVCGSARSHCLAASVRCMPYSDTFNHCIMHRDAQWHAVTVLSLLI